MGNTAKIREILNKMPRWPKSRIPRGDELREIERKLSYYGEGYSDAELNILSAAVDAEVKRMWDRSDSIKRKNAQKIAAQKEKEADHARRFGNA